MNSHLYTEDILRHGFEELTIHLTDDYQGHAIATLVRRKSDSPSHKAVLYVHGFNDYFFQAEMAYRFNEHGFHFYALDLRRYGRSYLKGQKFNDIRNLKAYYEEIEKALDIIHSEENDEIVLMGHSTGGLLLTLFAKDRALGHTYSGLILNSPFYELNKSRMIKMLMPLISFVGRFFPNITVSGGFSEEYGKNLHTSSGGEGDYDLHRKPHLAPNINLGWLRAIHRAQKELRKPFLIGKPVLILHSERTAFDMKDKEQIMSRDAILNVEDIERIGSHIQGDVQSVPVKGGVHDLVLSRKPVREKVYETIFGWLAKVGL